MTDNVQLARDLFAAVYRLDFDAAAALFTDDGYYHDMPLPSDPTVGPEAIRAKLGFMTAGGVEGMDYEIRNIVGEGDVVLVERSETWIFPSGARPTLRVMCTIDCRDGKIAGWREYWNYDELMSQMPPEFFAALEIAR
jgi:limonene-1,2-epoxide hydrolase